MLVKYLNKEKKTSDIKPQSGFVQKTVCGFPNFSRK